MLTEEQKKFAEENHKLIYSFMKKFNIPEEEYGVLAIAYCHAAAAYKPECGSFSTYAFKAMQNELRREYKRQSRQKNIPNHMIVSLNEPIKEDGNMTLEDVLPAPKADAFTERIADHMFVKEYLSRVNEKERKALLLFFDGVPYRKIGKIMGYSGSRAGDIVKKLKVHYKEGKFPEKRNRGRKKTEERKTNEYYSQKQNRKIHN